MKILRAQGSINITGTTLALPSGAANLTAAGGGITATQGGGSNIYNLYFTAPLPGTYTLTLFVGDTAISGGVVSATSKIFSVIVYAPPPPPRPPPR